MAKWIAGLVSVNNPIVARDAGEAAGLFAPAGITGNVKNSL
jgi:hypothetical protein